MNRRVLFAFLAVGLFAALSVMETLTSDDPFEIGDFAFDLVETALLALAVVAVSFVALETRELRRERADLLNDLARASVEGDKWRTAARAHIDGLSRAIQDQFEAWSLTESEADIASMMLKGLSMKEIGQLRDTSEATVRQQAAAIYRKAGLSSRAELSAFFLEDLLAPKESATPASRSLKLIDGNESANRRR